MPGGFQFSAEICNGNDMGTSLGGSNGTTVIGGTNNTKGSYVQLTASCPSDIYTLLINCQETGNSTRHAFVDIAIGAGGSEQVIISNLMVEGSTTGLDGTDFLFPVSIPAGTRIAARVQNGSATADGPTISICGFDAGFSEEGFAGVDDIGSVLSTTYGTTLTASATTNTKGSYAQLTASTAKDYAGFWIRPAASGGTTAPQGLLDVAIGASGSEVVIVPNMFFASSALPVLPYFIGPFWIPLPAGTRVAARIQSTTASDTVGLQLYGIYK